MQDSLSQDQVDDLFDSGADLEADPPSDDQEPEVRPYDFEQPSRISKEQERSTEALYGVVASGLEGWIRARLRGEAQVIVRSLEQLTYGEFVLSLPSPCASFVYEIGDAGQRAVIDIGSTFAFYCVDRLLGGSGDPAIPDRGLSRVETSIVRRGAERVAQDLEDAWEDHMLLRPRYDRFESTPEMIQVLNREDPVLVANLEIRIQDRESLVEVCLPYTAVEEHFSRGDDSSVHHAPDSHRADREDRRRLETSLRKSRVPVDVRMPTFRLPVRELTELEEGDVLPTDIQRDTPLDVRIFGQKRFEGEPGRAGSNLAVRVTDLERSNGSDRASLDVLRRSSRV